MSQHRHPIITLSSAKLLFASLFGIGCLQELQPRLVPEVRLDVLVEVRISIGAEFVLSIQSPIISEVPLCQES